MVFGKKKKIDECACMRRMGRIARDIAEIVATSCSEDKDWIDRKKKSEDIREKLDFLRDNCGVDKTLGTFKEIEKLADGMVDSARDRNNLLFEQNMNDFVANLWFIQCEVGA